MEKNESREDYLEAILMLSKENEIVRSIDIANHLNFSRPSVSIAIKKLKSEKLVKDGRNGGLVLTHKGKRIALSTLEKHEFLTSWFESIGVDPKTAEDTACAIEHSISEDVFKKIKKHLKKSQ